MARKRETLLDAFKKQEEPPKNGQARDTSQHEPEPPINEESFKDWHLKIERGNPRCYLLRSPIWQASLHLDEGYIRLNAKQVTSWNAIRAEAIDQSGIYVPADSRK